MTSQRGCRHGAGRLLLQRRCPPPLALRRLLPLAFCPPRRREEVAEVYNTPLLDLVFNAASVHRMYNDPAMVGGCSGW